MPPNSQNVLFNSFSEWFCLVHVGLSPVFNSVTAKIAINRQQADFVLVLRM